MTSLKSTLARVSNNPLAVLLASSVLFTAGCATMETTATSNALSSGAEMTGKVHGGNNPVGNASVLLYSAGQSGPGSAPTLYAQTTTSNDGTGSFRFTKNAGNVAPGSLPSNPGSSYQCPTGTDPYMYIYAAGGNTTGNAGATGNNNTAAAFLAPVGFCSAISNSTFVDVSEVTTVATVAAAAQFINPNNDNIGADGTAIGYQSMAVAFKAVANLVSQASGAANTTATLAGTGTGVTGVNMTVTAPTATLNTIANILAACINQTSPTSGTNCSQLFGATPAPANAARTSQPTRTFGAATDTIQAALYMFLNPTTGSAANRTTLFNLQAAAGAPFQPVLSSAPANWTLALSYSTANLCSNIAPGASTAPNFFSHPYDLNIDPLGNIWIANKAGTNGGMVEISGTGTPLLCLPASGTGQSPSFLGGGVSDSAGNNQYSIWFADYADKLIYAYTPSTSTLRSVATAFPPLAITADGTGNIFFTTVNGTPGANGTVGSVYEILNASNNSATISNPLLLSSGVGPNPARMFPDAAEDIWITSGANFVTELTLSASSQAVNNYLGTQINVTGPTYGIMVGPNHTTGTGNASNSVFVTSQDSGATLSILTPNNAGNFSVTSTYTGNVGGLATPTGIWLDGAQNVWAANGTAETSGLFGVSAVAVDGTAITPTGTNGGYQNTATYYNAMRGLLVDPVGNVWITNDNNPNSITELVGAAVPVVGPYSAAIPAGRFQTIP